MACKACVEEKLHDIYKIMIETPAFLRDEVKDQNFREYQINKYILIMNSKCQECKENGL